MKDSVAVLAEGSSIAGGVESMRTPGPQAWTTSYVCAAWGGWGSPVSLKARKAVPAAQSACVATD